MTFPEGKRTRDGKIQYFKKGFFVAGKAAGLPIVPLAVHGLYEINRAKTYVFKPGKIKILVGPQFETANLTEDELKELPKKIQEFMDRFLVECDNKKMA